MKRAFLLFGLAVLIVLPSTWTTTEAQVAVEIRNFHGSVHALRKIVRLAWWAAEEQTLTAFRIEHSTDGVNYIPIGEVPAIFVGEDGHIYDYWHLTPALGTNHYNLVLIFDNGEELRGGETKVDYGVPPIYSYPTLPGAGRPGTERPFWDPDNPWSEAMILDLYGRPVQGLNPSSRFAVDDLPAGIYIFSARYAGGWQSTRFVITDR